VAVRPNADAPLTDIGVIERAKAMGSVTALSGGGTAMLFDRAGSITVTLVSSAMPLSNADDAALLAGANLAVVGGEVIQFGRAEPLSPGVWRLSQLLRGRRGTEDAMASLSIGDGFALLDDPALLPVPATLGFAEVTMGGAVAVSGVGDEAALVVPITAVGRALRPLSPVHGRGWRNDAGGLTISWIRRSRGGFGWSDGGDVPLDERVEQYRLTLSAGGVGESVLCNAAQHDLDAAALTVWAARGPVLALSVTQIGECAESLPLIFAFHLTN
jgi:hypothetical protein